MKSKIAIVLNIVIALIIIAGLGYWLTQRKTENPAPEPPPSTPVFTEDEQQARRDSIATPPLVGEDLDLTEEQIQKYLDDYDRGILAVQELDFDSLNDVNNIAQIKYNLGDFDGAIAAWEYANFIRPANSLSFSNLAALYHYDLHEFTKAEENYRISVNNDPDDIPTIRNFYELYYYDLKDYGKAEQLLLQGVENNPLNPDVFTLIAKFYADRGDNQKAVEYYQRHLELVPDNEAVLREVSRLQDLLDN